MIKITNFFREEGVKWVDGLEREVAGNATLLNKLRSALSVIYDDKIKEIIREIIHPKLEIKFKRLTETAKMPTKAHHSDAGFDLYADSIRLEEDGVRSRYVYHTGIAMEIPSGHVGLIYARSSICKINAIMTNFVGVVDSGYRGDILLTFKHYGGTYVPFRSEAPYEIGERIGQIIIVPYPMISFVETKELSKSDRGDNGHGSSGK